MSEPMNNSTSDATPSTQAPTPSTQASTPSPTQVVTAPPAATAPVTAPATVPAAVTLTLAGPLLAQIIEADRVRRIEEFRKKYEELCIEYGCVIQSRPEIVAGPPPGLRTK